MEKQDILRKLESRIRLIMENNTVELGRISNPSTLPRTNYNLDSEKMEAFSRLMYIFTVLFHENICMEYIDYVKDSICHCCDPDDKYYWGKIECACQIEVEFFPILLCLFYNRQYLWEPLSKREKLNIKKFFSQINRGDYPKSNWLFFKLLVNAILIKLEYDSTLEEKNRRIKNSINKLYLGTGWYEDGKMITVDYYNSFAFHFYGLMYSTIVEDEFAEICQKRALDFSKSFIYFFDENGAYIPFGRSLTYRFAVVSFWSACFLKRIDGIDYGIAKGVISRNINWWSDLLDSTLDLLPVGYKYPNIFMGEEYNGFGSSSWAYKAFVFLLADDEFFWSIPQKSLPQMDNIKEIGKTGMMISRENGNCTLYPNRVCFDYGMLNFKAKYMKLAYNSTNGFCVSRDRNSLQGGGFDSTVVIKVSENCYLERGEIARNEIQSGIQISDWRICDFLKARTHIIPNGNMHIRVHLYEVKHKLELYESGFSIEDEDVIEKKDGDSVILINDHQFTEIISLVGHGEPCVCKTYPGLNIVYLSSKYPYFEWSLNPGKYCIVTEVLGGSYNNMHQKSPKPQIELIGSILHIKCDDIDAHIDIEKYHIPNKSTIKYLKHKLFQKAKNLLKG